MTELDELKLDELTDLAHSIDKRVGFRNGLFYIAASMSLFEFDETEFDGNFDECKTYLERLSNLKVFL